MAGFFRLSSDYLTQVFAKTKGIIGVMLLLNDYKITSYFILQMVMEGMGSEFIQDDD